MKKFILNTRIWALAILAVGFVACEDDGEPEDYKIVNALLGKWNVTHQGSVVNGTVQYTAVDNEGCAADYIAFDDNNFERGEFHSDGSGNCTQEVDNGTYYVEFGNVYLATETDTTTVDILTLDKTKLQVVYSAPDSGSLIFLKLQKEME